MVDLDLLKAQLQKAGHTVGSIIKTPENAGEYEFIIDGRTLTLDETRALLAEDQADMPGRPRTETYHDEHAEAERIIDRSPAGTGSLPTSNLSSDPIDDERPRD